MISTHHPKHTYPAWLLQAYLAQKAQHAFPVKRAVQAASVVAGVVGGVVILQCAYPSQLALPQARVGGNYYGFRTRSQVATQVETLNTRNIKLGTRSQTQELPLKDVGIRLDGQQAAQRASHYTWKQRLIPFSIFFAGRDNPHFPISTDEVKAAAYAATLVAQDKPAVNATVKIENKQATTSADQAGYSYQVPAITNQLKNLKIDNTFQAALAPTIVEPTIRTESAQAVADKINQRLQTPFSIEAAGKKFDVDAATLESWMTVTTDQSIALAYDPNKVRATLKSFSSQVFIADTPNRITIYDGVTNGNSVGASGRAMLLEETLNEVIAAANANATLVLAKMQPVTPQTQVVRNYSRSSKGLQALLDYWTQTHRGDYGIVVKSLDGNLYAGHAPNKQFMSASTYKIYVAHSVYNKISNGEMSFADTTSTGASVSSCLESMIVRSDNACAGALGSMVGWNANDGLLRSHGLTGTTLTYFGQLTTAQDAATWLQALQAGSITNAENTNSLLSMMRRQIYRYGIPLGSTGAVANKLGTAGNYNNDVAIVYHPKGAYILTVFSNGSSFSNIADLARQISNVMSQ